MKSDKARKWLYTAGAAASVLAPYVIPHLAEVAKVFHAPAGIVSALAAAAVAYKAFQADPQKKQKQQDAAELLRPAPAVSTSPADTTSASVDNAPPSA